jgi:hypothetical protein
MTPMTRTPADQFQSVRAFRAFLRVFCFELVPSRSRQASLEPVEMKTRENPRKQGRKTATSFDLRESQADGPKRVDLLRFNP